MKEIQKTDRFPFDHTEGVETVQRRIKDSRSSGDYDIESHSCMQLLESSGFSCLKDEILFLIVLVIKERTKSGALKDPR